MVTVTMSDYMTSKWEANETKFVDRVMYLDNQIQNNKPRLGCSFGEYIGNYIGNGLVFWGCYLDYKASQFGLSMEPQTYKQMNKQGITKFTSRELQLGESANIAGTMSFSYMYSEALIGSLAKAKIPNLGSVTIKGAGKAKTLYHYTNEKGMNGIVESKQLNPSLKANNIKDARYGNGQYLSDINPITKTPAQLAKEFINVPNKYKYTNYVEIDVAGLNVIKGREGVYVILNETPLDLTGRIVSYGKVGGN